MTLPLSMSSSFLYSAFSAVDGIGFAENVAIAVRNATCEGRLFAPREKL